MLGKSEKNLGGEKKQKRNKKKEKKKKRKWSGVEIQVCSDQHLRSQKHFLNLNKSLYTCLDNFVKRVYELKDTLIWKQIEVLVWFVYYLVAKTKLNAIPNDALY